MEQTEYEQQWNEGEDQSVVQDAVERARKKAESEKPKVDQDYVDAYEQQDKDGKA